MRVRLVLLLGFVLFAAGCGGAGPPSGRVPVRVFVLLLSPEQVAYYRWAEAAFEAENPDVDVVVEQFPGTSLKDFEIKLRLRFASGQAPDVMNVHQHVAAQLARLGLLAPAPPEVEAMVQANSLNDLVRQAPYLDGTCYGIASDAAWTVLYYNRDHFRRAGLDPDRPPRTWAELLDYAERLTVRGPDGRIVRAGLSLRKSGYQPGIAEKWLSFLYSAGGRPFDEAGTRAAFDSPEGRAALALYRDVLFDRRLDAVTVEGDQQGFGQGRVSMFVREAHVLRWLATHHPDLDFGVAPLPALEASVSYGAAYLFAVSAGSPRREAAWRFVRFVMGDEGYARYAAVGGVVPVTRSVAARPAYAADPRLRVFFEQAVAPNPAAVPRVDRALGTLGAYLERFCYGHLGLEETLRRAARDVDALLARPAPGR